MTPWGLIAGLLALGGIAGIALRRRSACGDPSLTGVLPR